jgi:hypothetical protein
MRTRIILITIAFGLLVSHATAQSGRKQAEPPKPVPVATPPAPTVEAETVSEKIKSLLVTGVVSSRSGYFKSNDLDLVIKEIIFWMKYEPRPFLAITKGGKMKFEDAKSAAKTETDRHILWVDVSVVDGGYGSLVVDYVDYGILIPQTGRTLLTGRHYIGDERILAQGGVIRIPTVQKRTPLTLQMKQVARELAFKLKATAWF